MAARLACSLRPEPLKRYLIQFAHDHLDFRLQEIKSIVSLLGCPAVLKDSDLKNGSPFMELHLSNERDARAIMKRTVLSKRLYELWADGPTLTDVCQKLKELPREHTEPYTREDSSFCIVVDSFNKKISSAEKIKRIEYLTEYNTMFRGRINLKSPDNAFHLLEYYHHDSKSAETPEKVYLGRWISDGQRGIVKDYHLQNRCFIANTSMDACLSLIMANMAQVKENDLVLDPFVGSGSLLVASAHFGAYVMGTDIDYMLLHAKARPSRANQKARSVEESVYNNLKQYGLETKYLDILVADASQDMWREACKFDAIITDPPYGIREAAARIVSKQDIQVATVEGSPHYPQRCQYQLGDIFKDLLKFAAQHLSLGGRLVYWLPTYKPDYSESSIPQHPCLQLESNCEQSLNSTISRRLITMVKVQECQNVYSEETSTTVNNINNFRNNYFKALQQKSNVKQNGTL
ncbi:tRNA (guanine(10)-N2)-methyltransferase [Biomphalaria glabrata]|uniref:tRNA (guanine(10)-N(2))-methyltransferase TRMT11 n=2 Tax=Biomphalaria glabrata TaxID=6526 RepID=A0A9U8E0N3_BIOGL|nr:tRNA (guanine(10)-N2)-methyltransferase homolog isoform X1 [Biomphalaria glabrata]KAI8732758.1 putative tRNA (guanine(10)-N2)-methyltransferase [Biomphalaria glabrata]